MLLQSFSGSDSSSGNAFQSYIGTTAVQAAESTNAPLETDGTAAVSVGFVSAMYVFVAGMLA